MLDFADEQSVVQTRFATTALALLRAHLGEDLDAPAADAAAPCRRRRLPEALSAEQVTFLGTGWTYGLAQEAALKMREAAGAWTESVSRHGVPARPDQHHRTRPRGLVLRPAARRAGRGRRRGRRPPRAPRPADPLAELIRAQRLAVAIAERKGYDPDRPRNLTRSVILA